MALTALCVPCEAGKPHYWHDGGTRTDREPPTAERLYPPNLITWDYYTKNTTGVPRGD